MFHDRRACSELSLREAPRGGGRKPSQRLLSWAEDRNLLQYTLESTTETSFSLWWTTPRPDTRTQPAYRYRAQRHPITDGLFCEFPEDSHFLRSGRLDCLIFSPPKSWSSSCGRPRPPYRGALTPPAPRFCSAQLCPRVLPVLLPRWQVPPREIPRSKSIIRADPLLLWCPSNDWNRADGAR